MNAFVKMQQEEAQADARMQGRIDVLTTFRTFNETGFFPQGCDPIVVEMVLEMTGKRPKRAPLPATMTPRILKVWKVENR